MALSEKSRSITTPLAAQKVSPLLPSRRRAMAPGLLLSTTTGSSMAVSTASPLTFPTYRLVRNGIFHAVTFLLQRNRWLVVSVRRMQAPDGDNVLRYVSACICTDTLSCATCPTCRAVSCCISRQCSPHISGLISLMDRARSRHVMIAHFIWCKHDEMHTTTVHSDRGRGIYP